MSGLFSCLYIQTLFGAALPRCHTQMFLEKDSLCVIVQTIHNQRFMLLLASGAWMVPRRRGLQHPPASRQGWSCCSGSRGQFVHLGVTKSVVLGELTPCGAGWLLPCCRAALQFLLCLAAGMWLSCSGVEAISCSPGLSVKSEVGLRQCSFLGIILRSGRFSWYWIQLPVLDDVITTFSSLYGLLNEVEKHKYFTTKPWL